MPTLLQLLTLLGFLHLCLGLQEVDDPKGLKKLLKINKNVLILYQKEKSDDDWLDLLSKAEDLTFNLAKIAVVKCQSNKKLCKEIDFASSTTALLFYSNGVKQYPYNRLKTLKSLVRFLEHPSSDTPWDEDPSSMSVRHFLSATDFNRFLSSGKADAFVMFYAPWCGHCKRLKPEFVEIANEYKAAGESLMFVAVDVDSEQNAPLARAYDISGFPTLLYFVRGKLKYRFDKSPNKEEILAWLKNPYETKKEDTPSGDWASEESDVLFLTSENFNTELESLPQVLVMFYAPWCGVCKNLKPHFTEAATLLKTENPAFRLAAIDASKDETLLSRFDIKGYPTLKYFERGVFQFDASIPRTTDGILQFTRNPQAPPPPEKPWTEEDSDVVHLTEDNFTAFMKKKKYVLVMFYAPWCGHCKAAKPEFTKAAATLRDNHKLALAAVDCSTYQPLCSSANVSGYPTFQLYNYAKLSEHSFSLDRDEDGFVAFMSNPADPPKPGPLKAWKDVEGVEYLLGLDSAKLQSSLAEPGRLGVFVMFQAPWCGHCKNMKPDFGSAAKRAAEHNLPVGFGVVDATVERALSQEYGVTGFPTLIMIGSDGATTRHEGGRSADSLLNFVNDWIRAQKKLKEPEMKKIEPTEPVKPAEKPIEIKKEEVVPEVKNVKPTPEPRKVDPTPEPKKVDPEPKKVEPTPEPKKVEPTPEPKKVESPQVPKKVDPTPEPKKVEPTQVPKKVETPPVTPPVPSDIKKPQPASAPDAKKVETPKVDPVKKDPVGKKEEL